MYLRIVLQIVTLLLSLSFHEFAHAFAAWKLGDPTAKNEGRVTLNPLVHIDIFGTVVIPLFLLLSGTPFLFGWAKPVPVNLLNLRNPRDDDYWISLAGPMFNFILALLCGLILRFLFRSSINFENVLFYSFINFLSLMAVTNLCLGVFNLIPVPPLDGFSVLKSVLPPAIADVMETVRPFSFVIFIILISSGIVREIIRPFYHFLIRFIIGINP